MTDAEYWIRVLSLAPHREGGFFRETYRSEERLARESLPGRFGGPRAISSAIFYLLRAGERSALHRLRADEVWHLYEGGPLRLHVFAPAGGYACVTLGRDAAAGERFQAVVPRGSWFGAECAPGAAFALVGCTVAPGFEYVDFEPGERETLVAAHPGERALIERLTPDGGA